MENGDLLLDYGCGGGATGNKHCLPIVDKTPSFDKIEPGISHREIFRQYVSHRIRDPRVRKMRVGVFNHFRGNINSVHVWIIFIGERQTVFGSCEILPLRNPLRRLALGSYSLRDFFPPRIIPFVVNPALVTMTIATIFSPIYGSKLLNLTLTFTSSYGNYHGSWAGGSGEKRWIRSCVRPKVVPRKVRGWIFWWA